MIRVPYEVMEDLVIELMQLMVFAAEIPVDDLNKLYVEYITECGWTEQEFDDEMLARVDASWVTSTGEFIKYWH